MRHSTSDLNILSTPASVRTPQIVFDRVTKVYSLNGAPVAAVQGLSFRIFKKEIVCFVGKTGCGKSTTFKLLTGLEAPTEGRVLANGRDPHADFGHFRSQFGMVFQTDRLLEWRTALQNVTVGLEILGYARAEREEIGRKWLNEVGLAGYEHAYPHQLSGGMRQRVAISRAFSVDPGILLCDEAFGHLDEITAEHLRRVFRRLVDETGKTALVITHDIAEAVGLGNRIVVLGKPARVLYDAPIPRFDSLDERNALEQEIFNIIDRGEPVAY